MLIREILLPFTTGSNYLEDLLSRLSKDTFAQQEWCIWIGLGSNNCLEGNIFIIEKPYGEILPQNRLSESYCDDDQVMAWNKFYKFIWELKFLKQKHQNPSYPGGGGAQN